LTVSTECSTGSADHCSRTRLSFAMPREIRYAKVTIAVSWANVAASTDLLAAQRIANRSSTVNHIAHSALPGTGRRAPVGQFIIGPGPNPPGCGGGGGGGACWVGSFGSGGAGV